VSRLASPVDQSRAALIVREMMREFSAPG